MIRPSYRGGNVPSSVLLNSTVVHRSTWVQEYFAYPSSLQALKSNYTFLYQIRLPNRLFDHTIFLNLLVLIRPPLTYQYEQLYTTKFSKFIQDASTSTSRCSVLEYQLVNTKFSFAHGYSWCKYLLPRV